MKNNSTHHINTYMKKFIKNYKVIKNEFNEYVIPCIFGEIGSSVDCDVGVLIVCCRQDKIKTSGIYNYLLKSLTKYSIPSVGNSMYSDRFEICFHESNIDAVAEIIKAYQALPKITQHNIKYSIYSLISTITNALTYRKAG